MATKRGDNLVDIGRGKSEAPPEPKRAIDRCSANGCPLPGTIHPDDGDTVCCIHFLANPSGWPKATAVILEHLRLYDMARQAQMCGTPMSTSHESALHLFDAAKAHGLKSNGEQGAAYKLAGMKLRAAGAIVEAAISAAAVKAALVSHKSTSDYSHEKEEESFVLAVRGLANNLRMGVAA